MAPIRPQVLVSHANHSATETSMYVCICVCVCMYVYMYVSVFVYMYVCMYVYVCVCVYMYICMYVCVCECIYGRKEMFYLTTHSTHFIYGYMASDIWLWTILIVRKETRCRHIGYSFRLAARVHLYAPYHRQDSTYHGLCYTSRGALAGTRNCSMGPSYDVST